MGELIKLRVFEDFFVDQELKKWKLFDERLVSFKKRFGPYESDWGEKIKRLDDPDERKRMMEEMRELKTGKKQIDDDRWHIREKHEREVKAARKLYGAVVFDPQAVIDAEQATDTEKTPEKPKKKTVLQRLKGRLTRTRKAKVQEKPEEKQETPAVVPQPAKLEPIEFTLPELKSQMLHCSTEEMAKKMNLLTIAENRFREAGQYPKADEIKVHRDALIEEQILIDAGFEYYLEEDQAIEFLKKSERGTEIDFLRYYDELLPADVLEKKKKADELLVFDNYVIAHYADVGTILKAEAKKEAKQEKAKKEKVADEIRKKRRDPILFGIIKNSRKLFYICDWVTKDDDLTLEKLEGVINQKRKEIKDSPIVTVLADGESAVITASNRTSIDAATRQLIDQIGQLSSNEEGPNNDTSTFRRVYTTTTMDDRNETTFSGGRNIITYIENDGVVG